MKLLQPHSCTLSSSQAKPHWSNSVLYLTSIQGGKLLASGSIAASLASPHESDPANHPASTEADSSIYYLCLADKSEAGFADTPSSTDIVLYKHVVVHTQHLPPHASAATAFPSAAIAFPSTASAPRSATGAFASTIAPRRAEAKACTTFQTAFAKTAGQTRNTALVPKGTTARCTPTVGGPRSCATPPSPLAQPSPSPLPSPPPATPPPTHRRRRHRPSHAPTANQCHRGDSAPFIHMGFCLFACFRPDYSYIHTCMYVHCTSRRTASSLSGHL